MTSGTRLGPYEIVAPIGAGGMGEVYRARDTRLDRSVAIKILPPDFAKNGQLKIRFEREAKTISQLSHPNICTLFDVGENYLVMELLEGETLADRLSRGPLPLADVLKFGIQIASTNPFRRIPTIAGTRMPFHPRWCSPKSDTIPQRTPHTAMRSARRSATILSPVRLPTTLAPRTRRNANQLHRAVTFAQEEVAPIGCIPAKPSWAS